MYDTSQNNRLVVKHRKRDVEEKELVAAYRVVQQEGGFMEALQSGKMTLGIWQDGFH
jgi:hypothetical protein